MVARHREVGDAWSRPHFIPYMVIGDDPSSKRHSKAFINSLATAFVDRSIELTFCAEVEVANDDTYPADQGFYDDYLSKGALLNQVYLEEDEGIE